MKRMISEMQTYNPFLKICVFCFSFFVLEILYEPHLYFLLTF